MSILVDTNILIHSVNAASAEHRPARRFLQDLRSGSGFCLSWSIVYECLRVVTHPRVFARPLAPADAIAFVRVLIEDPRVDILRETARHARVLERVLSQIPAIRGNLYHDVHIAAIMLEHGIGTIATRDRHFRLFPFIEVVDPLADG